MAVLFQTFQDSRCHKDVIFVFTSILIHTCATVLGQTVEISGSLSPDQRFESDALGQSVPYLFEVISEDFLI